MKRLEPARFPWTRSHVILCSLVAVAAYLALKVLSPLRPGDRPLCALARTGALAAAFVLPALGILLAGALRRGRPGKGGKRRANLSPVELWFSPGGLPRDVAAGLVLGLLLAFMNGIWIRISIETWAAREGGGPVGGLAGLVWGSSRMGDVAVLLVALGFVAPVAEEVFFRGVLYPGLRRSFSTVPAVIFSSMIFGAAHLEAMRLHAFLLGLVAAILVEYTGSLVPAILAHMGVNVGFVLFLANGGLLVKRLPFWGLVTAFAAMNVLLFLLGQPLFGSDEEGGHRDQHDKAASATEDTEGEERNRK